MVTPNPDTIFQKKKFQHVYMYISGYNQPITKKLVTKMKPFKFASCLRKPHLSSSMRSKVIHVWIKHFNLAFAISSISSNVITLLFLKLLLNALSQKDAVCIDSLQIWRALFMSPIFLWFVESLWSSLELNLTKLGIKRIAKKVWNSITPHHLARLFKLLPWWMAAVIQSMRTHT